MPPPAPEPPTGEPEPAPEPLSLREFIETYHTAIAARITESYTPTYRPAEDHREMPRTLRQPLGIQEMTIRGISRALEKGSSAAIVGEMGAGKTFVAITAAAMAGIKRLAVLCPPHLAAKWQREVQITLPPTAAKAVIARSITDLERLRVRHRDYQGILFVIIKREGAALSHGWTPQAAWKLPINNGKLLQREERRNPEGEEPEDRPGAAELHRTLERIPICPRCCAQPAAEDGSPLSAAEFLGSRKKLRCRHATGKGAARRECGAPLWSAKSASNMNRNRIGLAEYIKKKMRGFFQCAILDEVHEYKAKRTGRGLAAATLGQSCGKTLILTGTLMGGYSSTLFYLLHRFNPPFRQTFGYHSEAQWVKSYGFYEYTILNEDRPDFTIEHGATSRRSHGARKPPKEKPGLMPGALFHLIENTAFIRLTDVTADLPPYNEYITVIPMDPEPDQTGWSQKSAYTTLYTEMREAMVRELNRGSQRLMSAYLHTMLSYPDAVTKGETAVDKVNDRTICQIPPLDPERTYPKEAELIRRIAAEKEQGRKCLVYAAYTGEHRDITPRIEQVLNRAGLKAAVMKAASPNPEQREKWINRQVENGLDALICNPRLVQTGLDLYDFPTIIWYQTEYSTYTMRQASRRSWRPGQQQPVRVHFLTYEQSLQSEGLRLAAQKALNSMAVEGEIPEAGLSAYAEGSDNVYVSLAKQIVGNLQLTDATADELQKAFSRQSAWQDQAETPLVDPDQWRLPGREKPAPAPGPEPATPITAAPPPPPDPATIHQGGQLAMFSLEEFARRPAKPQ